MFFFEREMSLLFSRDVASMQKEKEVDEEAKTSKKVYQIKWDAQNALIAQNSEK